MTRMPALFIGHGSPMNTLELNRYTRAWRAIGEKLPRPRAILAISAHWYIDATMVTAMANPRTIHDFGGFPQPLFDFQYPAVGAPDVALEVVEAVKPDRVGLDRDEWGLDHGTWSVLAHLYPRADIPVLQLSINATKPFSYHFDLGVRLNALRDQGVLILSSGNVVHNLKLLQWHLPSAGADWALRFDEAVRATMADDPSGLRKMESHADYAKAVPTPEHYLPLACTAGIAAAEGRSQSLLQGYAMGALSMTSYSVGPTLDVPEFVDGTAETPGDMPPDLTGM